MSLSGLSLFASKIVFGLFNFFISVFGWVRVRVLVEFGIDFPLMLVSCDLILETESYREMAM